MLLPRVHVPHLHRPVRARGDEPLAVGAEAHAADPNRVSLESEGLPLSGGFGTLAWQEIVYRARTGRFVPKAL